MPGQVELIVASVWEQGVRTLNFADSPYDPKPGDRTLIADCTEGVVVIRLPQKGASTGRRFDITKLDNSVNVARIIPDGSETISGLPANVLSYQNQGIGLACKSEGWGTTWNPTRFAPSYFHGFFMSWIATNRFSIYAGDARDSTDAINIRMVAADTANITVASDRDFTPGANQWVYAHVIADSSGVNPTRGFLSLSATAPTLPSGYTHFRRIGVLRCIVANTFLQFVQVTAGWERRYYYDEPRATLQFLTSGNQTGFTAVSAAALVPPTATKFDCLYFYLSTAGLGTFHLRPTGSVVATPVMMHRTSVTGSGSHVVTETGYITVQTYAAQSLDYNVTAATDALTLQVAAYYDEIE